MAWKTPGSELFCFVANSVKLPAADLRLTSGRAEVQELCATSARRFCPPLFGGSFSTIPCSTHCQTHTEKDTLPPLRSPNLKPDKPAHARRYRTARCDLYVTANMGRSTVPSALIELSSPSSPETQLNALRNLKNEIVGHEQRKELAVTHGVVKPLAGLLRAETRKGGKRRRGAQIGGGSGAISTLSERVMEWSTEDELRLQATLVVGSLANGKWPGHAYQVERVLVM